MLDRPEVASFIHEMDAYRHAVLTVADRRAFAATLGYEAVELGIGRGTCVRTAPWSDLVAHPRLVTPARARQLRRVTLCLTSSGSMRVDRTC